MMRHGAAFGWLLFVWVALVGSLSVAHVVAGAIVSAALLAFFHPMHAPRTGSTFRPLPAARLFGFFIVKFIAANVQVALAVIRPERVRRKRAIIAVPIVGPTETTTTLLANAVSLTPGTFILELQRDPATATMYVHVLQLTGVRAARLDILELERRIVQAFGPPGAVARVDELMARVAADVDE